MNVGQLLLNSVIGALKIDMALLWQMFLADPWPSIGFIALCAVVAVLDRLVTSTKRSARHPRY